MPHHEREGVFPEDNDYEKVVPHTGADLMGSVVYCIHHKEGCKWTDELRKLQGHLTTCKYDAVPCTQRCNAMIPRLLMEDHLAYTCPSTAARRRRCEHCQGTFPSLESHVCQLEPVYCENKCGAKVARRRHSEHRLRECSKRLVPCPHCRKEFVFDTLQIHLSKCPRLPVPCPNRCEPSAKIAKEELEAHLSEKCAALSISCTFKDVGCKFKGTRPAMDQHLEDATQSHLSLVCALVTRQQQQIGALKQALLRAAGLHNTTGTLLWKISDYSRRMEEARHSGEGICSQPFYTGQHGYKLMATIFLNGNGSGEGSHISLYIKLLPGEWDALLPWPFSHTVTFVLFDQQQQQPCHLVESFVPDPTWKNFQRPSREPDALGFGFPRFASHELVSKRGYVKDDTLFVQVKVDASKIVAV